MTGFVTYTPSPVSRNRNFINPTYYMYSLFVSRFRSEVLGGFLSDHVTITGVQTETLPPFPKRPERLNTCNY